MECGIVGLPNIGKSTLFNALTATSDAQAANYPFCTIEPNKGCVLVQDHRLECLAEKAKSEKMIPQQLTFVDIAGLVKGASQGEGLGNQFLSHIRQVDAIIHVVRCFEGDITHVMDRIDPVQDIEIIQTELMLADLESIEKRLAAKKKNTDPDLLKMLEKAYEKLSKGVFSKEADWSDAEKEKLHLLQLLTLKPMIYVCNVDEDGLSGKGHYVQKVKEHVKSAPVLTICHQLEYEIAMLEEKDQKPFLESVGLKETGLNQMIRTAYDHLGLMTFFTVGPKEARAWTLSKKSTAFDAAGKIHTDFQKGFIRAEVISYEDYIKYDTLSDLKAAGRLRLEGKDYLVKDADIMHFRFNV